MKLKINSIVKTLLFQYLLIISGFMFSLIFGFFWSELFKNHTILNLNFEFFIFLITNFSIFTLSILYFTSPIFGLFLKNYYKFIFLFTLIIALIISIFLFIWAGGFIGKLRAFTVVYGTCLIIPVCYCFAWAENKKYWAQKDPQNALPD